MYVEDLTPLPESQGGVLAVGWLSVGAPISQGKLDPCIREELVRQAATPSNLTRGLHYCDFCNAESPIEARSASMPDLRAFLGSGEIWIEDGDCVYAAPTLIIHYIDAHKYFPPLSFQRAVLRSCQRVSKVALSG